MTNLNSRAERHLGIAAERLAAAEATGDGKKILAALYTLLTVGSRFGLECGRVDLSSRSMYALHAELAPRLRYGFQADPADVVTEQLGYYGEAFVLTHNGRAVAVMNGDAAEA